MNNVAGQSNGCGMWFLVPTFLLASLLGFWQFLMPDEDLLPHDRNLIFETPTELIDREDSEAKLRETSEGFNSTSKLLRTQQALKARREKAQKAGDLKAVESINRELDAAFQTWKSHADSRQEAQSERQVRDRTRQGRRRWAGLVFTVLCWLLAGIVAVQAASQPTSSKSSIPSENSSGNSSD